MPMQLLARRPMGVRVRVRVRKRMLFKVGVRASVARDLVESSRRS